MRRSCCICLESISESHNKISHWIEIWQPPRTIAPSVPKYVGMLSVVLGWSKTKQMNQYCPYAKGAQIRGWGNWQFNGTYFWHDVLNVHMSNKQNRSGSKKEKNISPFYYTTGCRRSGRCYKVGRGRALQRRGGTYLQVKGMTEMSGTSNNKSLVIMPGWVKGRRQGSEVPQDIYP